MEESNEETTEQSNDEPTPAEEEEMPESPQDSPFLFPNATIQDSLNDASLNSQTPSSSPNSDLFSLSVGTPLSSVSFSHVVQNSRNPPCSAATHSTAPFTTLKRLSHNTSPLSKNARKDT